jgi:hypothetical protein
VHGNRSEFCGGSDAVCTPPVASSIIDDATLLCNACTSDYTDFTATTLPASIHDAPIHAVPMSPEVQSQHVSPPPATLAIDNNDVVLDSIVEDFDFAMDYSFDADTDDLLQALCS